MQNKFGNIIRDRRVALKEQGDKSFSLRQVAMRIGVEPSYLSKVERGEVAPPSEEKILRLARELGIYPDYLLALAGKVASDLQYIIRERPVLYGQLIRAYKDVSDDSLRHVIEQVQKEL